MADNRLDMPNVIGYVLDMSSLKDMNSTGRNIVSDTVRKLRGFLNETQEQFARRMNTAVVTIARWETKRPPRGKALKALEELANSVSLAEYAEIFSKAKNGEFPGSMRSVRPAQPEFRNEEELLDTLSLLRVYRQPDRYGDLAKKKIKAVLKRPRSDIELLITDETFTRQTGVDVRRAIIRLFKEGRSQDQIAEIFGMDSNDVAQVIVLDHLGFYAKKDTQ